MKPCDRCEELEAALRRIVEVIRRHRASRSFALMASVPVAIAQTALGEVE